MLAAGWIEAGTTGSHVKFSMRSAAGVRTTIVPKHREIATGTLRSILRQAGISPEEFDRL
ncbi:MAG: type II toxin-antitoxin system HicA family toxin [Alphaproteobacteria bacterium]